MPIHFAEAPAKGEELVRAGLERTTARTQVFSRAMAAGEGIPPVQIDPPHAVYDLRADELAKGSGLASATQTSFRYMVGPAGGSVAAAEVVTGGGQPDLLANVNQGPFVAATTSALAAAAKLPAVQGGAFEACVLRCSAIYLMALWLKSEGGGQDIILPMNPAPTGLTAEEPYTVDAFLKIVQPMAEARIATGSPIKTT